jgi:Nucleotidyl transferase AbiEii toxin, Type IV TA system
MEDSLNLSDSPEFEDAVRAAAEHHGILPALVRKDYWVTRVLRSIATDEALHGTVLFKGGTSLSKGWRLIERFSEDVDLLLTGPNFGPMPDRTNDRVRQFRAIKARIEADTTLRLPAQDTVDREVWNFHYTRDQFHCNIRYPLPGSVIKPGGVNTEWVLVETGFRGGVQPHARRSLNSLIGEFVDTQPASREALVPYVADLTPFEMDLLKPERTFAEKILLLHIAMSKGDDGARDVKTRHYYDVAQLFAKSADVKAAIASRAIQELFRAAAEISNRYFNTDIDLLTLVLRDSPALAPTPTQRRLLKSNYEKRQERAMYYKVWLPFDELMEQVSMIRAAL